MGKVLTPEHGPLVRVGPPKPVPRSHLVGEPCGLTSTVTAIESGPVVFTRVILPVACCTGGVNWVVPGLPVSVGPPDGPGVVTARTVKVVGPSNVVYWVLVASRTCRSGWPVALTT